MRPIYTSFLSGIVGVWLGATTTYILVNRAPNIDTSHDSEQLTRLLKDSEQTKILLQEFNQNLTAGLYHPTSTNPVYAEVRTESNTAPSKSTNQPAPLVATAQDKPDLAVHEMAAQDVITRLSDPSYAYSTNFAEVLRSDDLRNMPEQLREQVIAKMVGMMNNGEIDVETFFPTGLAE